MTAPIAVYCNATPGCAPASPCPDCLYVLTGDEQPGMRTPLSLADHLRETHRQDEIRPHEEDDLSFLLALHRIVRDNYGPGDRLCDEADTRARGARIRQLCPPAWTD
jgi:hypothetical protein